MVGIVVTAMDKEGIDRLRIITSRIDVEHGILGSIDIGVC
jgi:hypothetical protein